MAAPLHSNGLPEWGQIDPIVMSQKKGYCRIPEKTLLRSDVVRHSYLCIGLDVTKHVQNLTKSRPSSLARFIDQLVSKLCPSEIQSHFNLHFKLKKMLQNTQPVDILSGV